MLPPAAQWGVVALQLDTGRTPAMCLRQWLKSMKPKAHFQRPRTTWTPEDNNRLAALVAKLGTNWLVGGEVVAWKEAGGAAGKMDCTAGGQAGHGLAWLVDRGGWGRG